MEEKKTGGRPWLPLKGGGGEDTMEGGDTRSLGNVNSWKFQYLKTDVYIEQIIGDNPNWIERVKFLIGEL